MVPMATVLFSVILFLAFAILFFSAVLQIEVEVSTTDEKYPGCDNLDFTCFEHFDHVRLVGGRGIQLWPYGVRSNTVINYKKLTKLAD